MNNAKLIVFLKAPRLGTVKTRLAAEIGPQSALEAYLALAKRLIGNLSRLANVELRFTPDDAEPEFQAWLRPGWQCRPQGPGTLGEKLAFVLDEAFALGAWRVVIIGSDCPYLDANDIQLAWTALKYHDLVLGPATDGGYWLIGLRRPCSQLFARIPWSTGAVLRTTLRRARMADLKVKLLRRLSDVDTAADWRQFLARDQNPVCGRLTTT